MRSSKDSLIKLINSELSSRKNNHYRGCAICDNKSYFKTHNTDRFGININFGICNNCGLLQLIDNVEETFYKNFYKKYYSKIHKDVEFFDPRRVALQERRGEDILEIFNQLMMKNNEKLNEKIDFVDIGCSCGSFLSKFSKYRSSCIGYDIDDKAIEYGQKLYKSIDLRNKDFFENFKRKQRTIFFLSHVLEHILDPYKYLVELKKKMGNEDMLYIAVPQITSLLIKKNKFIINQFTEISHVSYFSKKTLKYLINKSGFSIVKDLTKSGDYNPNNESTYDLKVILKPIENSKAINHKITYCNDTMRTINLLKIKKLGNKFKLFQNHYFRRLLFSLS